MRYSVRMTFEQALKSGNLDEARALLAELAVLPDTGGLYMPECYADLARSFDHERRHDDAVTAMERAIEHGWNGQPDGRSDIAEFHLRAGRAEQAAEIWAQLKAEDPDEIWLYNAAGLSYNEVDEHKLAVTWLGEGIELGMSTEDPNGIVAQMSDIRLRSLQALDREPDELEQRVEPFLKRMRATETERKARNKVFHSLDETMPPLDTSTSPEPNGHDVAVALAWFPQGEYERAIERWPSLAENWADVAHADYCQRLDGNVKWMRARGVPVRAIAPIVVDDFVAWCEEHDEDPEDARAAYAAHSVADGEAISATRAKRALLVRLAAQIQEVLRNRPSSTDAPRRGVARAEPHCCAGQ